MNIHPYDHIQAKILMDSVEPRTFTRLTTMELVMPRFILAEFNTHRVFSRNSASSRAIPLNRQINNMNDGECYIPIIASNRKGMSADDEPATLEEQSRFNAQWHKLRKEAQSIALGFEQYHKQWVSRVLEPWMLHKVIVTSTEWANFFMLRANKHAQPEIQVLALRMMEAMAQSEPMTRWIHAPYVVDDDLLCRNPYEKLVGKDPDNYICHVEDELHHILMMSAGRCARVSYKNHDGVVDPVADIALAERLRIAGHMSPFEHQAICGRPLRLSNLRGGWVQYRGLIEDFSPTLDDVYRSVLEQYGETPTVLGYEVK